jgi:hypothetical protein
VLKPRIVLPAGLAAVVALGVGWHGYDGAAPGCDSRGALNQVDAVLRDQYHLDSIFLNNIKTVSGGLFSERRDCSAEVAAIRGNVNASDMPWREIRYRIEERDRAVPAAVSVTMGDAVPLAKPAPSLWERLFTRS